MKYNVGDYVANDRTILQKVEAVIDGEQPVYCLKLNKRGKIWRSWETEYELDKQGLTKRTPDFERWNSLKQGDIVHVVGNGDTAYAKVLVRLGDLVMLSDTPASKEERKTRAKISEMASQIEELTDGKVKKDELERIIPPTVKMTEAHKIADGNWISVEELALMNWKLIGGE